MKSSRFLLGAGTEIMEAFFTAILTHKEDSYHIKDCLISIDLEDSQIQSSANELAHIIKSEIEIIR